MIFSAVYAARIQMTLSQGERFSTSADSFVSKSHATLQSTVEVFSDESVDYKFLWNKDYVGRFPRTDVMTNFERCQPVGATNRRRCEIKLRELSETEQPFYHDVRVLSYQTETQQK